jgi:hypothetical protein
MGSSPPAREQQADHSIKLCKFAMTQGPMTVILGKHSTPCYAELPLQHYNPDPSEGPRFAVGTAVASRPPRRSVRAGFPHTAPTLSK